MESYKTQDYTDANDVLSEAEMNAIFEKILKKKRKNVLLANTVGKKMRVAVLVVGKCPRIKSMSVPRLSLYPIINVSLCREKLLSLS